MEEHDEIVSEMDVDPKRVEPAMHFDQLDDEYSNGEMSEEEEEEDDDDWTKLPEEQELRAQHDLAVIRSEFVDDVDLFDTTMVAEYADDIFSHMGELEKAVMPSPRYMDFQTEIEW